MIEINEVPNPGQQVFDSLQGMGYNPKTTFWGKAAMMTIRKPYIASNFGASIGNDCIWISLNSVTLKRLSTNIAENYVRTIANYDFLMDLHANYESLNGGVWRKIGFEFHRKGNGCFLSMPSRGSRDRQEQQLDKLITAFKMTCEKFGMNDVVEILEK